MDNIEIISTLPGDSNFHLFESFPKEIYAADSIRFKLTETINKEFLESCFVITANGKPLARAALYNNPYLNYRNKKTFCVGNYESIDDIKVSAVLLEHIYSVAKNKDAEFLIGPMNGSTWDSYRFSTHHNFPNFFLEPYHHLYYNDHFLNNGFEILSSYFSSIDKSLKCDHPDVISRENELINQGVKFRNVNLLDFESELKILFEFNSIAFKTNFLYSPILEKDFINKYVETKKIINPEFVILAEDADNNLIGYLFCVNDLFNTKEKSLIIKTAARHPDKKWKGLGHVMSNLIYRKAISQNYKSIIHALMLNEGTSKKISKDFSGDGYKNYTLYGKSL